MKNLLSSLCSGFILAVPALLGLVVNARIFKGEYFSITYTLVLGCFGLGSFGVGLFAPWLGRRGYGRLKIFALLFGGACLAWLAALIVLGVLNLTPLCIGQNNGDGFNRLGECVIQTIAVGLVSTPIVLALLAASASAIAGVLSVARIGRRKA
jgi:hypothetical protein